MHKGIATMQGERMQGTNQHADDGFLLAYAQPYPIGTSMQKGKHDAGNEGGGGLL